MRLIDADQLLQIYGAGLTPKMEHRIRIAPTVDAVPVVRCKDCRHKSHDGNDTPYCLRLQMYLKYLNKELDFFCSYGERKEGGK